jgi:uncharacterized protein (TIGR02246 family)
MENDEQQIRRLIEEWHRKSAEGDLDAVMGLMADDVVFLTCGRPPMTRKEFAAGFREWAGRMRIESKFEVKDIHASGDVGYAWSYISIVMTPKEKGAGVKREGHVLSVFRKSASGKWVLARDANLMPAGG